MCSRRQQHRDSSTAVQREHTLVRRRPLRLVVFSNGVRWLVKEEIIDFLTKNDFNLANAAVVQTHTRHRHEQTGHLRRGLQYLACAKPSSELVQVVLPTVATAVSNTSCMYCTRCLAAEGAFDSESDGIRVGATVGRH